jgi:F-type H+-transporting ATPase subunit delta
MRPSSTALRYSEAAFAVAQEAGTVERWRRDLDTAAQVLGSREAREFFREPRVGREEKLAAIDQLLPSVGGDVRNLLRLLALRDRVSLVSAVRDEFIRLDREARGIVEADVTVAREYGDTERAEIERRLAGATGKRVEVKIHVDPSILGGIVVRVGDRLIDGSVAGRLQRLRHEMAV